MNLFSSVSFLLFTLAVTATAADKPNIVWILSEDNSKHYLKLFDDNGIETPHIAKLAEHGLIFTRAFSNAPVCSVARSTLATGCLAPRIGTQYHRRSKLAAMPEGLKMFPSYLRDAGYYTTNNSKKDYNAVEGPGVWDESSRKASWRNRPDQSQPFFHMETHTESHESSLHFDKETFLHQKTNTDPNSVNLAKYHPDTPLFRYTHARYLDEMVIIDDIVGKTVAKLEEDGLLEDTFIFYFGDHGGVLPRSKGYVYESGLHVPLVVRVPEKWKHLVDGNFGDRVKGFVNFIDFGPTVLRLAGLAVPKQMDGRPFLGKNIGMAEVNSRDEAYGYADRMDEKYDFCRSLRKGKWKYIRNYQPYYPDALQNNYRYKMLAYQEWRDLFKEGKLGADQRQFFEARTPEALYDVENDPDEVNNLIGQAGNLEVLKMLRDRLTEEEKSLPDLSFFPESRLYSEAMDNSVGFGQKNRELIESMVDTANLELLPFGEAEPRLRKALISKTAEIRYWAATACAAFGSEAAELGEAARPLLNDKDLMVRVRAAEFLGLIGAADPRTALTEVINTTENPIELLIALNSAVFFQDHNPVAYPFDPSTFHLKVKEIGEAYRRIAYLNGDDDPPKPKGKKKRKQ